MEFSFDRSNDSQSIRVATQPVSSQNSAAVDDGADTSTIANERLRKAIERNRARQAERNRNQPSPSVSSSAPPINETQKQTSLFDRPQTQMQEQVIAPEQEEVFRGPPPQRPRVEERAQSSAGPRASTVVTRRSVARPNEADFTPVKRAPRRVANQISYTTTSDRKKSKAMDPTIAGYLIKGSWIFCAIMVLRLIFATGGVTDYYSRRSVFDDRLYELDRIKKENMQLVQEIERMQSDSAYQKKLVRDNLGFIASDEFLILFPKEKSFR